MSDEQKSTWEAEVVPDRNKLLHFIVQRVKQGATKEQLLEVEVPDYIKQNGLPDFPHWDVEGIIDWAIRKFSPSSKDEIAEALDKRGEEEE